MSNSISKYLGAGLLTLAVVGGTGAYLTHTLQPATIKYAMENASTEQSPQEQPARHPVVIVTEGWAS